MDVRRGVRLQEARVCRKAASPAATRPPPSAATCRIDSLRVLVLRLCSAQVARLLARLTELAVQSVEPQQWTPPYQGDEYYCAACPRRPAGSDPMQPWLPWIHE